MRLHLLLLHGTNEFEGLLTRKVKGHAYAKKDGRLDTHQRCFQTYRAILCPDHFKNHETVTNHRMDADLGDLLLHEEYVCG